MCGEQRDGWLTDRWGAYRDMCLIEMGGGWLTESWVANREMGG